MESIKPSFDVVLQTGIHRGLHSHNFYKKRRAHSSKSLDEGTDIAGRRGHDRQHGAGKDDAAESRYSGDWHSRPSHVYGDIEKLKMYERGHGSGARHVSNIRDMSPPRHHETLETGDIEKLKTYERQQSDSGAQWMTSPRDLSPVRHYKTLETGVNRVVGVRSKAKDHASPGSSLSATVMRASRLATDDLNDRRNTYATLPHSSRYHHYPGAAVISVEELPVPQRGTYIVETEKTLTAGDDDRAVSTGGSVGWQLSSAQSDGPHVGIQPVSVRDDELMSYVHATESTPTDFTLNAILAKQQEARRHERVQSTGHLYTVDDEILQLHRLLENPFTGHEYARNLPKQQVRLEMS